MTNPSQTQNDPIVIAENEGVDARRIGVSIEHNPYEVETYEYDAWERGWESGQH